MTDSLPAGAVVRIAHLRFDPDLYDKVAEVDARTASYLIPAIERLPGFRRWYTGLSRDGSLFQVSVWDSEEHAEQMEELKEMAVDARQELRDAGIQFTPELATRTNYPMTWSI